MAKQRKMPKAVELRTGLLTKLLIVILAAVTLVLGLCPTPLIQLIQSGIAAGLF